MPRQPGEPLDHWHERAATTYWQLVKQAAADRHNRKDPQHSDDALAEAFADWYAASTVLLKEKRQTGKNEHG